MRITINVNPNSRTTSITKVSDTDYVVKFKTVPEHGEANKKLVEMLAKYFQVPKKSVHIVRGMTSRVKVVEIFS